MSICLRSLHSKYKIPTFGADEISAMPSNWRPDQSLCRHRTPNSENPRGYSRFVQGFLSARHELPIAPDGFQE